MYPKVEIPKKEVTQAWRDQAFAPLRHYLEAYYPDEAKMMMVYLDFMGNEEGRFCYRNCITRARIEFDQSGELICSIDGALEYRFDELRPKPVNRPPKEERYVHPSVEAWILRHLKKRKIELYGDNIRIFLQELWGPVVNYDFNGLKAVSPIHSRQLPYCLYLYPSEFEKRITFQFIGDEIVERKCTRKQYNDYVTREREMVVAGWKVISITHELLDAEMPEFLDRMIELAELQKPYVQFS